MKLQRLKQLLQHNWRTILGTLATMAAFVGLVAMDYRYAWTEWGAVRNPNYAEKPQFLWGRTLWDWLNLLIVPIVLAIGGYLFSRAERKAEREIADHRTKTDREIADDRLKETALQGYLDRMTELMLDKGLRTSKPEDEVRNLVRARTLTVLRTLDGKRKGVLLRFLHESVLIQRVEATVGTYGENVLCPAIVDLQGADLCLADLCRASLVGDDLNGVDLSCANVHGADLSRVDLTGANLSEADLREAYMHEVDLSGANLHQVDLSGADLREARVTDEQLSKAASLRIATLPNGAIHD